MTVFYAWLDPSDKIISAGMSPDRETYDRFIAENPMPGLELVEVDTNLTGLINHTYDRDTGETTPPEPAAIPTSFAALPTSGITMEDLIIALDEKENGDPSKWNELLAQTRNNTDGQPP